MASDNKAERIDEFIWNRRRSTIERLYVTEQRKLGTPNGVIEHMKKYYGFVAR